VVAPALEGQLQLLWCKKELACSRGKEREKTVHLVKEAGSDGIFVKTDLANEDDVRSL
jgi:hypothetical protein